MNEITVSDIKSQLDIVQVVERYGYTLKKEGSEYKGAISATSKSGKSLNVNPDKQVFNDFAGHAGSGDVFDFIAFAEGLDIQRDFAQVLRIAAGFAGIILDNNTEYTLAAEKKDLHRLNRLVFGYYHSCLTDDTREYIRSKWGISDKCIDDMLIGYAPDNCRLLQVPEIKDYTNIDTLKKSGLFYCNDNDKLVDIYRGRIIFPYWFHGEIVYSIGRDPKWDEDKNQRKFIKQLVPSEKYPYVSTAVENTLFGKDSIKGNDTVYIAEGIADAIALLQAGVAVLSPVTTRFKESDINGLVHACKGKKLVKIVNDNETNESGLKGAMDTAKALEASGIRAEIIVLPRPEGKDKIDVADYLKEHGIEELDAISGQSVWEILLYSTNVPEKEQDRPRAARDFIETELVTMNRIDRKVFCLTVVKKYFRLSTESMRDVLKTVKIKTGVDKYYTGEGKFVPTKLSDDIQKDHIFATFGKEIWVYNPDTGCYQPDGEAIIRKRTRDVLEDDSIEKYGNEVVYDIAICTQENRAEFDAESEFVNLQNGYVNIYTREFIQHSPKRKFTSTLPIVYDPAAKCPKFDDFIKCTGVDRTQILEAFAYCLVPGYPIHTFIIFIGDGGNGKGTLIRLLGEFLGSHNTKHYTMQELAKDRYAKGGLFGKYANLCGDMPSNYIEDTAIIKTLSGGDSITARNIYGEPFDFTNRAKLIFSMNHIPKFDDTTDSTFRRILIIEFNNRVMGLTEGFNESDLAAEIPGIFNEALEVLPVLLERGDFTGVKSVEETREYIIDRADSVAAFLKHCTEEGSGRTKAQDAYTAYTKFCREKGETRKDIRVFGKRIKDLCPDVMRTSERKSGSESKIYYYSGLELKAGYTALDSIEEDNRYLEVHNSGNKKPAVDIDCGNIEKQDRERVQWDQDGSKKKNTINQYQDTELIINGPRESIIFNGNLREKKDNKNIVSQKCIERCSGFMDPNSKNGYNDSENDENYVGPHMGTNEPALDPHKSAGGITDIERLRIGEKIEVELDKWEKHAGPIFKKNAPTAKMAIVGYHAMFGINPQLIFDAVDTRANTRCVDCGSSEILHKSELLNNQTVYRCQSCWEKYQSLTPVKLPETGVSP